LGAALAEAGCRVLVIDLDPQSHLSLHFGVDGETNGCSVYDLFVDPSVTITDTMVKVRPNLSLVPAVVDLAAAETELSGVEDRNEILRRHIDSVAKDFDCVLIDCPPSLGLLTLNALAATEEVIVPMQAHFLALQGVSKLLETVALVSQGVNDSLRVSGVILCNHETQSTHGREVVAELQEFFESSRGSGQPWENAQVFMPAIRRNIKLAEAPSFGQTIFDYAPWCPGAIDYRTLSERLMRGWASKSGEAADTPKSSETTEVPKKLDVEIEIDGKAARNAVESTDDVAEASSSGG
jgi:chromosome partitioning protein